MYHVKGSGWPLQRYRPFSKLPRTATLDQGESKMFSFFVICEMSTQLPCKRSHNNDSATDSNNNATDSTFRTLTTAVWYWMHF